MTYYGPLLDLHTIVYEELYFNQIAYQANFLATLLHVFKVVHYTLHVNT